MSMLKFAKYSAFSDFLNRFDCTIIEGSNAQGSYDELLKVHKDACQRYLKLRRPQHGERPKSKWWNVSVAWSVRRKRKLFVKRIDGARSRSRENKIPFVDNFLS